MSNDPSPRTYRYLLGLAGLIVVMCVVTWFVSRDAMPRPIRIATAGPDSMYQVFAEALQPLLERRASAPVELHPSSVGQTACCPQDVFVLAIWDQDRNALHSLFGFSIRAQYRRNVELVGPFPEVKSIIQINKGHYRIGQGL